MFVAACSSSARAGQDRRHRLGGQILIAKAGESKNRLLVIIMAAAGALTALISGGGAVAALMPVVVLAAIRLRQSPTLLLMPLAFSAHAGANILLTGAPKNILVSEALEDNGLPVSASPNSLSSACRFSPGRC